MRRVLLCTEGSTHATWKEADRQAGKRFRVSANVGCSVSLSFWFGRLHGDPCIVVGFPDDARIGHSTHLHHQRSGLSNIVPAKALRLAVDMVRLKCTHR
jgi:hypothetical protein